MRLPSLPCRLSLIAPLAAACLALPAAAQATEMVPNEVVVKRHGSPAEVKTVTSVPKAIAALERSDDVEYAAPNPIARAAAFYPNDPGFGNGWATVQWNFLAEDGVNAPEAWQHAIDAGNSGGRGVRIAVLDSGVAYTDRGKYRQSPDLGQTHFTRGYDFVDDDPVPADENGHGTHVASTIAESTNNGRGLTGLAYGATIVPVRVLDRNGEGDAARIADAVRWAVRQDVQLINLSLEFGTDVGAREIPSLLDALAHARKKGVLVIGAAGNEGDRVLAFPARSANVLSVGATTEHGCLSDFSNLGRGLDIVAPGGGTDAALDDPNCDAQGYPGRPIYQVTMEGGSLRRFGTPNVYEGTSMAVPHVTATAALIIASRVLGANPTVDALTKRLQSTARDLGQPGQDTKYGAGLVDAAAATAPNTKAARAAIRAAARKRR